MDAPEPQKSDAERRAEKMLKRQERNLRKAGAEGFLAGVCAMLRPGDLALDCGANMGVVTTQLARSGADVIAYEPDPFAFAQLRDRFDGHDRVTLVQAALGTSEGTVDLMRAENFDTNPEGASVKSTILPGGRSIDAGNAVSVPLMDFPALIERLVAERGEIAFVKMDIEGAELAILETLEARGLLAHIRCLVAETHERKFKDLRPRFRALRADLGAKYPRSKVNLDWI